MAAENPGKASVVEDVMVTIEDQTESHPSAGDKPRSRTGAHKPTHNLQGESASFDKSFIFVAENEIEAHRISNNYKFGLKKWKSHVTSRPLATRSEIVQDLYADVSKVRRIKVTTLRFFNIVYTLLFGWWVALAYCLIGCLMFITILGKEYGFLCFRLADYFLWPFGKFIHQVHHVPLHVVAQSYNGLKAKENGDLHEKDYLLGNENNLSPNAPQIRVSTCSLQRKSYWKLPETYLWLLFGVPVLWLLHAVIWFICWLLVVTIPVAKINSKMMLRIMFMRPQEVKVEHHGVLVLNQQKRHSEIIMFTHQAVNVYYYKLTVDGINVILFNLLLFVILSLVLGYADQENVIVDATAKCVLAVFAIIPLTYYVGMAITSVSAQSSFAVGAILNATFGSMVEVILFIIMLKKGRDTGQECYQELVKSSLAGAILVSILFIPGMSMVVGGLKYRMQNFNPKSANISSALLFVSIAGVFAPTVFSLLYGDLQCEDCQSVTSVSSNFTNVTGFHCKGCFKSVFGIGGNRVMYDSKVAPLAYSCAFILPIAYIIGLIFTMRTHSSEIYEEFETQLKEEIGKAAEHGSAHWSIIKSVIILLLCAAAIALCGDIISENIQPLLQESGMSEYFIGVTMLSLVAELPEVVNGIQFALQNNVNLGIEIGSSTAIQVCLVQVPMLVLVDVIYPMGFHLIFAEVHFWAVIFSVIVINYIFQDGKSDYFQGTIVVFIYVLLMVMYVFTLPPDNAVCAVPYSNGSETINSSQSFLI
ncbi:low affinity vacuolar monovalent cation/H(+) antiporter-like [Pomacea canaliculata]|uniref:low affinity vacuolar monovalent cation/H(+) antiporter-like n=1 Tax=Pomacea canaliculata TaxID=400727 RepID=UPI000D73BA12|nr:low affinity vacuolar monovalent cation/H(+) antiporter-like [Pomacea canaliculata]XP_025086143.1 low affinity vacuolar monovalent cation/H(+) antiporter-like [Pomacea canaliculata]XP_025086144.1 low affinity vacuolar monovalent cation/H(+) antiporter-like [Pomacea canaliculata]